MAKSTGKLFGIGVGPGDPDLIPLKSVKILQKVDLIFAASSSKNNHSQAVNIAAPHIPDSSRVVVLPFPMTKDMAAKKKADLLESVFRRTVTIRADRKAQ